MTTRDTVAKAIASRLGVDATASAEEIGAALDKRLHEERLAGAMASKLGLPWDTSGADLGTAIVAEVNRRLDVRAAAVGLPAGAKLPDIAAAEADATKTAASSTAPATATSSVERTLAEIRDRLPKPPTAEELAIAEENAAIDGLLDGTTPMGSVRVPGEWSQG